MPLIDLIEDESSDNSLSTITTPTLESQRVAEAEAERNQPTWSEGFHAARDLDSTAAGMAQIAHNFEQEIDTEWEGLQEEDFENSGVPQEYWGEISGALSAQDFEYKKWQYEQEAANEQTLADMGVSGMFTRIGTNIVDEGAIGLTAASFLATGGTSVPAVGAFKATRLHRAIRLGLIAGAENAALETVLAEAKITSDWTDVVYAGLAGFTLGGAVGGLSKGANDALETSVEDMLLKADVASGKKIVDDLRSAGAAEADDRAVKEFSENQDVDASEHAVPKTADVYFLGIKMPRVDIAGKLGKSEAGGVRKLADDIMEEGVAKADDSVNNRGGSASHWKRLAMKQMQVSWRNVAEPAYQKWSKAKYNSKERFLSPIKIRDEFMEDVSRYIELGDKSGITDESIIKTAKAQSAVYKKALEEGKRLGVKGMSDIPTNPNYFPHMWQEGKFGQWRQKYGQQPIELLKRSLIRGSEELTDEVAGKLADSMWKTMTKKSAGLQNPNGHFLSLDDVEDLKSMLRNEDMDESQIEGLVADIMFKKDKSTSNKGKPQHLRRRLNFDLSETMSFKLADGSYTKEMSLTDLMERNSEKVINQYLNQTTGMLGLARKGIKSKADWNKKLNRALEQHADFGDGGMGAKKDLAKVQERLELAYKSIMGQPLSSHNGEDWARAVRLFSDLNYTRYMGQTGAASLAEAGQALAYGGVRNALVQMPGIREMARTFAKGNYTDDIAEEVETFFAAATHSQNNQINARTFDHDTDFINRSWDNIDKTLQVAKVVTSKYSGLTKVTDITQKIAARGTAQKMFNHAMDSANGDFDKVWTKHWKRMQGYGLTKEDAKGVFKEMHKHSDSTKSSLTKNGKLKRMNLAKWDRKAADDFTMFVHRVTTHAVQEEDVGNLHEWIHNPIVGKIFMQFRRFVLGAYTKTTLNGLHYRDVQAGLGFVMSAAFGTASYMAQTSVNSIGRDDQDEYLDERFELDNLVKAGFQRSAFASFSPMVIDMLASPMGEDPIFSYRSSGLESGFGGIPAVDTLSKLTQAASSLASPVTGREYTQEDLDATTKLSPLSNLWGLRNFVHILNDGLIDLPKEQDMSNSLFSE